MTPEPLVLRVDDTGAGERLDRFLAQKVPDLSRSRLAQLADEGHVQVDGKPAKPSVRLKVGATISVLIPPPEPATPQPENLVISTLYDDSDVIVVNKAAGMVVHPAAGAPNGTLVNALLHHVGDLAGIGGTLRPGIVHRLDKETSGAMVVAKNDTALMRLQAAFQARDVEKRYLAIVHGTPPVRGTFDTPFGRHPIDRVRMTGKLRIDDPEARRAVTHWQVLENFEGAALVDVTLETGRTHQIRVHFFEAGFPLLGDETYGGTKRDKKAVDRVKRAAAAVGRQALHARVLDFPHPRTGERVRIEAPIPPEFAKALAILRGES